jgi:phage baseplate assembly protein W
MANLQKIYSDIDFTFTRNPVTSDVALSYDRQAVIRSIRNLLQTKHYDRLFNPDLGSNVDAILFENMSDMTAMTLQREVSSLIKTYEPRAILKEVTVSPLFDKNAYNVSVTFFIENATQSTTATILLERNR